MDDETRRRVQANLFPQSRVAVVPWDQFPWHTGIGGKCDTWVAHSSQALAIDVFGLLKVTNQTDRDAVLGQWANGLELPTAGPWSVELEWSDPDNLLKERRPTQVDAVAESPQAIIFIEAKFTEQEGGGCSQPLPLGSGSNKGKLQCNGNYELQTNPVNDVTESCALTGKGIRYWDVIPKVFNIEPGSDHKPCPFAGSWFQWMRNLVVSYEVARHKGLSPAFVLAYADGIHLSIAKMVQSNEWARLLDQLNENAIGVGAFSYQQLISDARQVVSGSSSDTWNALDRWVQGKIKRSETTLRSTPS